MISIGTIRTISPKAEITRSSARFIAGPRVIGCRQPTTIRIAFVNQATTACARASRSKCRVVFAGSCWGKPFRDQKVDTGSPKKS
jgi:hypothetical protein